MKIKYILKAPILPIVTILAIIVIIKIIKETGITEFTIKAQMGGEILSENFKDALQEKYWYWKPTLNALNIICWFYIIKFIFL